MASDLSSGCTETIDILDDEKEEGEISLEDVSSSEEGGVGHLTSNYVISKKRSCTGCKSTWGECASWCTATYHSKNQSKRDLKGKENRHHIKETGCAIMKHTSTLQEKNDDLVPISSDSDMEIVGLTDTSNRSKAKIKKKKKQNYDILTSSIDDLISPASADLPTDFATSKTHYRELNPVHKSVRSRVISKSPIRRYRSPMRIRSPVFRSSHSPSNYSKSPVIRRSPRRLRSPKQISPHRSTRTLSRKPSRPESSLTRSYNDRHGEVTRLLKKVKRLDSVGVHALKSNVSRSKKSSSLKHKIFNMLRKIPDNKDVASQEVNIVHLKEKSKVKNDAINDADDEEDLALLRQKALETKQKKSTKLVDCPVNAESEKKQIAKDDDQDVEALQLRMIALHSAIMKKHQDRVQRGIRTKKKKSNRSESPFNQNFLDDIPVPGEELLKFASPPCTPPHTPQLADSNHAEDMELDTDVEREKEKLPYSPTDRIISEIPIDTALLGIEPSDVSFINVTETNSPVFDDEEKRNEQMPLSTSHSPYYNNIYSLHRYETYPSSQHDDRIFHSDLNNVQNHFRDYHNDNIECDLLDGICCQSETHSKDTVYEKSDAVCALPTNNTLASCNLSNDNPLQMEQIIEKSNDGVLLMNIPIFKDDKYPYEMRVNSEYSGVNSAKTFTEPVPSNELIMINDITETEVQFTFPSDDKNLSAVNIPKKMTPSQVKTTLEPNKEKPLYMQGVSDITDDLNKIPTLINRTLVPASILKSNKQLQQQLPKKHEIHPTFKSAEMQPVIVNTIAKSDSTFKPIKLPSKKSTPLIASVIFDNSNENSENDILENRDNSLSSKNETTFIDDTMANDDISMRKKRKRIKKKRKSALFSFAQLLTEKDSCNANDNMNTSLSSESTECTESEQNNDENNDENKTQKYSVDNKELSNLQNSGSITQESLSDSNNIAENKDANKEDQNISLENEETTKQATLPITCLQEKSTKSYSPTNIISNNINSGTLNITETTKDNATNRRQSIDEDEDELRAILLASLAKRSKSVDTNGNSAMTVAANFITTNTQTITQKTLADEPTNITLTINHNAPLESKLNSSETNKKKIPITASAINNKKKISEIISHVPRKMKRISIPASTKVVNNAKKYQNMIVQRKLNLRKLDNACNNVKPNENVWSNASKTLLAKTSDTQRFVINLGSDTDSESETEKCRPVISTTEKSQQDVNADFEKSLQKFLRDMRKEQEQSVAKPISTSQVPISSPAAKRDAPSTDLNKGSSNMHTPLAVRHLPASQQEEYHRLKQQILEREKLKLQRKIADNNNSNKLLDKGVIGSPMKSLSICEKKNINVKQNQTTSREEGNSQKLSTQIGKKNIDVATNILELNASPLSANKNHSANVGKHTNSTLANLQVKGIKKAIPNNLSIRITNEIAPKQANKVAESSIEKQSVNDKQQHRPALRALSKEEINRKYVSTQVQLKSDAIGRVVTVNDKLLQHDVTNVNQSEKLIDNHDVNIEIMKESKNNENSNNSSTFSNISTIFPHDTSLNINKQELVNSMETTMSHSQYETECQEINCNTSVSLTLKDDDSNNVSHKSDIDKNNTDSVWNVLKKNIRMEMDSLINLSKAEQQRYLRDTEHKLVAKRYIVLDHLAEMSGNFRQWDMEKDLQNSLAAEVKKLEEQLKMAEERLQSQRDRVNGMGPKISIARQKISAGRRECFKLSKICSTLGNQLMGKNYKLPEAGGQLLSDKFKEVAEHTRQFSKKKRTQSNDVPESFYSNSSEQIIDLSKITRAKENLLSQEQLRSDVADVVDVAGSKSNSSCLRQSNDSDNILILDDSFSLDNPEIFPNQITVKKKDTLVNISESYDNEQIIVPNQSNLSIPKLNSIPIERNNEHTNKSHSTDISDPAMSSVPKSLATNIFLCKNDEQRNDKETSQPSTITMAYTTTTTTMTTTAVVPYVSILTHLNTPRNTNPHGILCPYEIMGICRDEDCQFIHQSKNET